MKFKKYFLSPACLLFVFNLLWFLLVYLAKEQLPLLILILTVAYVYYSYKVLDLNFNKLISLVLLALIGILFDFVFVKTNLLGFVYQSNDLFLPIWLICIWFLFSFSLPAYKKLFENKIWLAGIVGGVFGPLSYYSVIKLGLIVWPSNLSLPVYILFWSIYFYSAQYLIKYKF